MDDEELIAEALAAADVLIAAARQRETAPAARRRRRLARMVAAPGGVDLAMELTDQVARIRDDRRAAQRLRRLRTADGPTGLASVDRLALAAGQRLGEVVPSVVMPLVRWRLRRETDGIVLPSEDPTFARHAARRRRDGVRLNINLLGEAVLGEREARRRLDDVMARLRRPDVDYVSVKISAISSHVDALAFDDTVEHVSARLEELFTVAAASTPPKFVNLDMEEYRDLHLTAAAFRHALDVPALRHLDAGIALQAYLPDSHAVLADLCDWAVERHDAGGGCLKVRIVKGANLAMERVEAELRGWPLAPYPDKAAVDASYKRLLDTLLRPEWRGAVRVGLASHNLFDVAWGLAVARRHDALDRVDVEMLEGMAEASAAAARERTDRVLLYEPVVRRDEYDAALAYLARRLEENTAPDNFLRSYLGGDLAGERDRFVAAVHGRHEVATTPRRPLPVAWGRGFHNEPDTDWTQRSRREALAAAVDAARHAPARPVEGVDVAAVERAVAAARNAAPAWAARSGAERSAILGAVADVMAGARFATIAALAVEGAKTAREGDAEVSEAVDHARYYAMHTADGSELAPFGTVVVASPWNFPYAIPAGGVLAALAAGNTVILKPAPETVGIGRLVAEHCWAAGVPDDVLQFLPCGDDDAGRALITHDGVDAVVLTGAYDTARRFLQWKPGLRLLAETSGKNAMVITACADLDLAIRDLVHSAFGHAGQKCSAASLAIVEQSVYDDARFRSRLADAVESLRLGDAWEPSTDVAPLVLPVQGPLRRALTTLDDGERWLVPPREVREQLWAPGVRLGVRPGSWFHQTECFGPVLGLMRAPDLATAVDWQNGTPFGLTGGIQSLDPAEVAYWLEHVEVGNAYVNRGTTGAIVRRQPFGGWKHSAVGPTAKAGGPDCVASMGRWSPRGGGSLREVWGTMVAGTDESGLAAEHNVLRYRPLGRVLLRIGPGAGEHERQWAVDAAAVTGTDVIVSSSADEDDDAIGRRLRSVGPIDRVRLLGTAGDELRTAVHDAGVVLDETPAVPAARAELVHWSRAQAISETAHRYGHIAADGGRRAG